MHLHVLICIMPFLPLQDDICIPGMHQVREALLKNPHYNKIGPAIAELEGFLTCWRRLAADGSGPALDAKHVQDSKEAITLGVETVGTTFAIFQLYHKISKEPLVNTRRDQLKALREQLDNKGVSMDGSMEDRMATLASASFVPES